MSKRKKKTSNYYNNDYKRPSFDYYIEMFKGAYCESCVLENVATYWLRKRKYPSIDELKSFMAKKPCKCRYNQAKVEKNGRFAGQSRKNSRF